MKRYALILLACALLASASAHAEDILLWTQDGYRLLAANDAGECLMLGEALDERDGLVQNVGVSLTLFGSQLGDRVRWNEVTSGDGLDKLVRAVATADGWAAAGSSSSSDLGVGWHPGWYDDKEPKTDAWIVRLDAQGQTLWSHCYGGTDWDSFHSICAAHGGGFVAVGNTYSGDGDVSAWHDSGDLFTQPDGWVVCVDEAGAIVWERALGGSGYDELLDIVQVPDGYMAVGTTGSADGDVQGLHGSRDAWVVMLDTQGNLVRQACYGGDSEDRFTALAAGPQGWMATGITWARGADAVPGDAWAVGLDANGEALWQCLFGSKGYERPQLAVWLGKGWGVAGYTVADEAERPWIVAIDADGGAWRTHKGEL